MFLLNKNQFKNAFHLVLLVAFFNISLETKAQLNSVILGRPTDTSITASVLFNQVVDCYLEYGTVSGAYPNVTPTISSVVSTPDEINIKNLLANTKYFYRVRYKLPNSSSFSASPEYSFHTQRPAGSTFTFTIEADEHLYDKKGVDNMYRVTLANQAADKPDFMLSLGDIFGDDHYPTTITPGKLDTLHRNYRPFLGDICHSIPFYVCLGNHEGENDYYMAQTPPNNLCIWGTSARQKYYPNPFPNGFYSGNTQVESYGIGNPENYYAWNWGNALFVVLDVYRDECDTSEKPQKWDWSLGFPQYTWLKNTLENSTAQFKFVFAHHIRGQGRGALTNAKLYEWGGYEQNGTSYTFPTKRPGWAKPIHQLFKDNGVNIFFQGHDHLFAHEILEGITYQEVPMAADSTYEIGMLANADAYTSDTIGGTGHVRVTVTNTCVKVDFVRAYLPQDTLSGAHHNREVAFSYTIGTNCPTGVNEVNNNDYRIVAYPNPANDKLYIKLKNNNEQHHSKLINSLGQLVQETSTDEMNLNSLPNGLYFLISTIQNENFAQKILINHP